MEIVMRPAAFMLGCWLAAGAAARGSDEFNDHVRPILAGHCFKCHGPDDKARKAKLRLDVRAEAVRPARSGKTAIVPGRPGDSELVQRVSSSDEEEVMPPPHAKNPLTANEKEILKRWIAAGAEYRPHWAFVPPRQAPLPMVKRTDWPRNPIDYFILSRLEAEALEPAPQADRYRLIRRLHLDLIGLPPAPDEVEAFVQDPSTDAYEKLVDRLLASPRYGERWARRWLDLARYADTNGYEKDRQRSIWPYRDWLIRALNADMPFDQFTIEQLAGDMLKNAGEGQRVATGFHRNTMLNEEGGIDPLEFRFYAMTDRVATTGTTWLGLTLGCAQCHSHKFDPISHKEYYQLFAFLNNADEPELAVRPPDVERRRHELEAEIAAKVAELPDRFPPEPMAGKGDLRTMAERRRAHLEKKFQEWCKREKERGVHWTVLRPVEAKANLPLLSLLSDNSVLASGDQTKSDSYELTFQSDLKEITAIRLEVLPDERLPNRGPGRVFYEGPFGDFMLSESTLTASGKPVRLAKASHSFAAGGYPAQAAIDGDPQTGWSINGGQGRAHNAVFNFAEPLADASQLHLKMLFERYYSAGLGRFRVWVTTDKKSAVARDLPSDLEELLAIPPERLSKQQHNALVAYFASIASELAAERAAIDKLRAQMPAYPTTLVMKERPPENPRPTNIHYRGEFLQPTERVEPGVPAVLPSLPEGLPRNRLGLAYFLVSPDNPLVGRVTMNRQWAAFFGRGLVRTLQDFGYQGERPTHPELLDFLALEFVRQGWSMKRMHKLMVTSATYRQASWATPDLLHKDPENRLLARGPRVRLEAEQIRDSFLRAAGLLSSKMGGPSIFPPQPPGVTTEGAYGQLAWNVSPGEDRYRRALYTFAKRTAPYAAFTTFDGPSGEVCLARREVSNTPLQALTLLNDPAFVEACQALGRMMAGRGECLEERVDYLFRRCLSRPPQAPEKEMLVRFFEAEKKRLGSADANASALAGPGTPDKAARAAWTALARALLNLDEAITKE
jgi:hypothetical protein